MLPSIASPAATDVGAVVGCYRRDAAAADAASQQLDSLVVAAHRIHRIGALCSA